MNQTLLQQITSLINSVSPLLTTLFGAFAGAFAAYMLDRHKEKKKIKQKYEDLLTLIKDQLEQSRDQLKEAKKSLDKGSVLAPRLWTTYHNEINYSDLLSVSNISLVRHLRNVYGCIVHWNEIIDSFRSPTGRSIQNPREEIIIRLTASDARNYIGACETVIKAIEDFLKDK